MTFEICGDTLICKHNAGFFSCLSQRLNYIVQYSHSEKKYPPIVDSSQQFEAYKPTSQDFVTDFTDRFIKSKVEKVPEYIPDFVYTDQFTDYKLLEYSKLNPLIETYFSPSDEANAKVSQYEKELNIDYENTCGVFYRGNDKWKECHIASHDYFIERAEKVKSENPNIKFHVQTDEESFLQDFLKVFPDSTYIDELERIDNKDTIVAFDMEVNEKRTLHGVKLIAAVVMLAKCKLLITHTGNCGFWSVLYRGHPDGIIQYYSDDKNKSKGWWIN
tara:strand:+ start:647 stop:1468 length:822 start_codon:yes stop_codon:yes gene_type:complete